MQQGIERGSRDRGKTGETWRLEEPERSHNGSGDDKRQSELHLPSDGRSRATLQTQLRKLHALGWMDERKCQGAAGICDESKQMSAVVGSSVGAETAAWQQITQMAIVDLFASGTAMQIEAAGSWIMVGLAAQAERERILEAYKYGREEVKSGLGWTNHVPLHSFFVSVLYGTRATCSLKEPCLLQTTPMASPAPIDSV
jgi:hypothetical protein